MQIITWAVIQYLCLMPRTGRLLPMFVLEYLVLVGPGARWKKSYDQPRQHIKKQRHYFANKGLYSQSYGLSSSHVWMWELDYKESWVLKNWCFWTVVLEKTLESPLDSKEIQPIHPKEISPEYSLEGLMLKLKLQYFGHLMLTQVLHIPILVQAIHMVLASLLIILVPTLILVTH